MLERGMTNGHFDVVVIELVTFSRGGFFCRSNFGACMTKARNSVEWDSAELIRHREHLSPIYWGVGGSSDGCNTGGEVWERTVGSHFAADATIVDRGYRFLVNGCEARPAGTILFRRIERRRDANLLMDCFTLPCQTDKAGFAMTLEM
jgi:hypothetical protein